MQIDPQLVSHIATLANIPITSDEATTLATGFSTTLAVVEELNGVSTDGVEPTHQVTGLENILRDDVVDTDRMFTQQDALANAHETIDGYFVVPQVIAQ